MQSDKGVPESIAETSLSLARTLASTDPPRARELAEVAEAGYTAAGAMCAAEAEAARLSLANLRREAPAEPPTRRPRAP